MAGSRALSNTTPDHDVVFEMLEYVVAVLGLLCFAPFIWGFFRTTFAKSSVSKKLAVSMKQLVWEEDPRPSFGREWTCEGGFVRYESRTTEWQVRLAVDSPLGFEARFLSTWIQDLVLVQDALALCLVIDKDVIEILERLWSVKGEDRKLLLYQGTLSYSARLFSDWFESTPRKPYDVSFSSVMEDLQDLRRRLEAGSSRSPLEVLSSPTPLAWRHRMLGVLLIEDEGGALTQTMIEKWGEKRRWAHVFDGFARFDTLLAMRRRSPWTNFEGGEVGFVRHRLIALLSLSEPLARRHARDLWEHHDADTIARAFFFEPEHWMSAYRFAIQCGDDDEEEGCRTGPRTDEVFSWVMDEGHGLLSFDAWLGLLRGVYRFSHTYSLVSELQKCWEAWPEEFRWAAQLIAHDEVKILEELCEEIGLEERGRAFWSAVLSEPIHKEVFPVVFRHLTWSQDATLLPMLVEARGRWDAELQDHPAWTTMIRALRENVDPETLGRLSLSSDGLEGGLSVAKAPEGALELRGEETR